MNDDKLYTAIVFLSDIKIMYNESYSLVIVGISGISSEKCTIICTIMYIIACGPNYVKHPI